MRALLHLVLIHFDQLAYRNLLEIKLNKKKRYSVRYTFASFSETVAHDLLSEKDAMALTGHVHYRVFFR